MDAAVQQFNVRAHLIPFVTHLLYRGAQKSHQPQQWPIPVGTMDLYTEEDMEAFKDILPQGVLYAFCHRAGGWHKRPVLIGSKEAWASKGSDARMWQALGKDLKLDFGPQSMALLEGLYNAVAKRPQNKKEQDHKAHTDQAEIKRLKALKLDGHGDLALSYWALCALWPQLSTQRLRSTSQSRKKGRDALTQGTLPAASSNADNTWQGLLRHFVRHHPMLQLRYGPWSNIPQPMGADIEGLIKSPLRGLLPWWISHALSHWQAMEASIWTRPAEVFTRVREQQHALIQQWTKAIDATGWYHLTPPLVRFFQIQLRWLMALTGERNPMTVPSMAWHRMALDAPISNDDIAAAGLRRLDASYSSLRHSEREALRHAWAVMLESVKDVSEIHRKRLRIHHADREANDVYMVDWASQNDLDGLTHRLREIARTIEGRLG